MSSKEYTKSKKKNNLIALKVTQQDINLKLKKDLQKYSKSHQEVSKQYLKVNFFQELKNNKNNKKKNLRKNLSMMIQMMILTSLN